MQQITLRVDDELYEDIRQAAEERHLTVSEMLRDLVSRKFTKSMELVRIWPFHTGGPSPGYLEAGVQNATVGKVLDCLRAGDRQDALGVLLRETTSCELFSSKILDALDKRYGPGAKR